MPEKFDELAHAAGVDGGGAAFVPWLKALKERIGIRGGLAAHGVTDAHVARMVPRSRQKDFRRRDESASGDRRKTTSGSIGRRS